MKLDPKYTEAMEKFSLMTKEEQAGPGGVKLLFQAHRHAPEEMKEAMREGLFVMLMAYCSLFPKPTYCTSDGETAFSTEEIAYYLGLSMEDAQFMLDEIGKAFPEDMIMADLHKMQ